MRWVAPRQLLRLVAEHVQQHWRRPHRLWQMCRAESLLHGFFAGVERARLPLSPSPANNVTHAHPWVFGWDSKVYIKRLR